MYNELLQLEFFLNSLNKANIKIPENPNDEILEKAKKWLEEVQMPLENEIPVEKFINFDVLKPGKKHFSNFDKSFLEKIDDPYGKVKDLAEFYSEDPEMAKIYDFDFFLRTIEIDIETLMKLFEVLFYSIPEPKTLLIGINSGFNQMNTKMKATYSLIKILCFNYNNFLNIAQLMNFYLEELNYNEDHKLIPKYQLWENNHHIRNKEELFSMMHYLISGLVINLVRKNYASNYFLMIDNKKRIKNNFEINFHGQKMEEEPTIDKIFKFLLKTGDFEKLHDFINALFSKNLALHQIPLAKIMEKNNILKYYPYVFLELPQILHCEIINDLFLKQTAFIFKTKIKKKTPFYSLVAPFSKKNNFKFIILFCNDGKLTEILKNFNQKMGDYYKKIFEMKEKVQSDIKANKEIKFNDLTTSINDLISNYDTIFPKFKETSTDLARFCHNIFKLSEIMINDIFHFFRKMYQNIINPTPEDENQIIQKVKELQNELAELISSFFMKNPDFIKAFFNIVKLFFLIEEVVKFYHPILDFQKQQIFKIYQPISFCFFSFLRIFSLTKIQNNFDIDSSIRDLKLPEFKKIQTKDSKRKSSNEFDISKAESLGEMDFEEVFDLIYKVQDSIQSCAGFNSKFD